MPHPVPSWLTDIGLPWLQEEASVFGQGPLIVADAQDAAPLLERRAELGSAILIGVDEAGELPDAADAFDVLLTVAPSPPRPWVHVQSIGESVQALSAAISANPNAAVSLVQLLRAQRGLSFDAALTAESFAYSTLLGGAEFRRWRAAKALTNPLIEDGPAVLATREDDTLRLVLARPASDNELSAAMRDELVEQLRIARLDPSIKTVEIASQGRTFCTGGAFDEFGVTQDFALAHQIRTVRSVAMAVHHLTAHSRMMIQGPAVGGGIEFAAAGRDLAARETAFFRLPEISMGLIPGAGGTVTIPRRIGWQRTCYMVLSGATIRARTALAWGLIDRIADA